jgi:IS5 family transposase
MSSHPRAAELCVMSAVLDANPEVLRRVHADLLRQRKADARLGREGMTAEQVVRTALIKQMFGISYDELAFQLGDSLVLRGFCRLSPSSPSPKRSALQANIASIRPETWEAMNRALVLNARERKVEDGRWMRTDTTVVESNIHHPLDSSLLFDGIRVLTRTLQRAYEKHGTAVCNHRRRAKRRAVAILHAGTMARRVPQSLTKSSASPFAPHVYGRTFVEAHEEFAYPGRDVSALRAGSARQTPGRRIVRHRRRRARDAGGLAALPQGRRRRDQARGRF